jgi:RsmE family RNA methyltransferase
MSIPNFIAPEAFVEQTSLGAEVLQVEPAAGLRKHLKAQRISIGEQIRLVDGAGNFMVCKIIEPLDKKYSVINVEILEQGSEITTLKIALIQGISAAERMDLSVRQACELGVSEIIPLLSQRVKVRISATDANAKQARWQRVASAACEQSGRATVPTVHKPVNLKQALRAVAGYDVVICPWEDARAGSLGSALEEARARHCGLDMRASHLSNVATRHSVLDTESNQSSNTADKPHNILDSGIRQNDEMVSERHSVLDTESNQSITASNPLKSAAVIIGPEGGFATDEIAIMQASGTKIITLGSTILRTETASTVALALVTYALGGLGANA